VFATRDPLRFAVALVGFVVSTVTAGCTASNVPAATAPGATAWRIQSLAPIPAEPTMKAVAAGILAYLQDTSDGNRIAAGTQPLCIGFGPAAGGPFRMQPLQDVEPVLLHAIAARRAKVHPVSVCETTLKGSPYTVIGTGETATLVGCLTAGRKPNDVISVLCGFYDGPFAGEFIGYDVAIDAQDVIVHRNGQALTM
jgi:hypothetical protein